jgi:toxin YhaV
VGAVEEERRKRVARPTETANAKVLAAIEHLVFTQIPEDPTRKEYRLGGTPGVERKHWFRAKFGSGRFRSFFRFRSDVRVILYVWVNDEETLRTFGRYDDAYAVFARMLDAGGPPEGWEELVQAAQHPGNLQRFERLRKRLSKRPRDR